MNITPNDLLAHNDKWLAWATEVAREYAPDRLDAFFEINALKPEHEKAIRAAL